MTADPVTLAPDMDIHRAMQVLLDRDISGAPVLDEDGVLVGILSVKDCLKVAFSASYHQEKGGWVSEFMSTEVRTMEADTDVVEAAETFLKVRYHRFPVLADGRLVGLISRYDILRALEALW
jgi:CBS domain-containing protein